MNQASHMLASTMISPAPAATPGSDLAGSGPAPATSFQEGEEPSAHHEAEPGEYYLYFLVSAATTGDLAGLFKVGVTDHLPTRYHQHTKIWAGFDLPRSALLRARSRWEVYVLEKILKKRFKPWRRHPGCEAAGHTEFFAVNCLPRMLAFVQAQVSLGLGAHLSRGIDPADCALGSKARELSALARKERSELVLQRNAQARQQRAEQGDHIELELKWVLTIARGHARYLVWVNLERWHNLPILQAPAVRRDKVLVDLYFGHFHPADAPIDAEVRPRQVTQARFVDWVGRLQQSAVTEHTSALSRYRPKAMFHLREPLVDPGDRLPHPVCADTLLLRVECARCLPPPSQLAQFEALAAQVGSLPRLEQTAFRW